MSSTEGSTAMSTTNSLSSHLEDLRNPQSPPGDSSYSGYNTPSRYSASFMTTHSQSTSSDTRSSLHRRFTADSGKVPTVTPTMAPIGPPTSQVLETVDTNTTTLFKIQAIERKRIEYEKLREQRLKFEIELENFKIQQAMEKKELEQMTQDLHGVSIASGHQSEPTTPPEYRDHNFPSIYSRRNRYSSSSLMSPPGLGANRNPRSGSQLQSPPAEARQAQGDAGNTDKLPSKSVPGSRRGSNDRITPYTAESATIGQRSTAKNRYSMPVTSSMTRKRESVPEYSEAMGHFHINTTGFLFGDDDDKPSAQTESATSPDVNTYLQMNTTDDKFPILIRNNQRLSASSAALDLALTQTPAVDSQTNGWAALGRHRSSQQSLPQNTLDAVTNNRLSTDSLNGSSHQSLDESIESPLTARQVNRHSMEATLAAYGQQNLSGQTSNKTSINRPSLANLQSSYSTNDIFTMKKAVGVVSPISPPKTKAEQQLHNHNASLGRIPANAVNPRHSRDLHKPDEAQDEKPKPQKSTQSELHASAPPFGPSMMSSVTAEQVAPGYGNIPAYTNPAYYGGYGMQQVMNMGMTPLAMNGQATFGNQLATFQNHAAYPAYPQNVPRPARFDSQARIIRERRIQNQEELVRFQSMKLDTCQGQIYSLCKDQHGCRYLQKQIESRDPAKIHMIFLETNQHVVELMTDPFGNYLCQKLFEYCNNEERTVLINNASSSMLQIALNQHGTRALQKLIEFLSTDEQVQTIIYSLKDRVVELIQDLNGNHVIQKCLNHLIPENAQFIFDSVGTNCIVVGTHRHGCCVLQRCIDHASGLQKAQLIAQITDNAYALVQDPFGNYVLQYIVDLGEPVFTTPLCMTLRPEIQALSKQKFSSNVIEKCIRGALPEVASLLVEEMLNAKELEKLLRDPYANYVVQTALEYAEPITRSRLVEAIRPILPSVRSTPYGRRIQNKILGTEPNARLLSNVTNNDVFGPNTGIVRHNSMSSVQGQFSNQPKDYQLSNGQYSGPAHNGHRANGSFSSHHNNFSNGASNIFGRGAGRPSRFSDAHSYNQYTPTVAQTPLQQHQQLIPPYASGPMNNNFNYF